MRPPALLAHSGPARLTTPRRTLTPPAPSAPNASASAPAFTSPFISVGASTALVSRRTAMLVPGSRPASFALTTDPPATIRSNSSRLGSDCSEATTTSGCQSVPVRCRVSESRMQHYAFLVSEKEFDQIFGRIKERGLDYWADPGRKEKGRINRHFGGRGVYFLDPSGHLLEIITRPYGNGG